jgi:predicted transcriptional regulator
MSVTLDDFYRLRKEVDELKRAKDKAQGAYDELMKRLKDEHGCKTIKEAKAKLKSLEAKERTLGVKYVKARKKFDKKWKGKT